jgi:diguanylate cyclase (GGDEF)-like protein
LEITLIHSVWIGLLIMVIVGLTAFFVSHNITIPIKRLVKTTKRIAAGDLMTKAEVMSEDEIGQLTRSFNEMMESLRKSEERLQYEAFHDVLTALPNRALLLDRLERLIERNRRHRENQFAVLFVDLDRFKNVNDSLGHTKGDELLIAISHRLQVCLRTMDTVARLGGDEFIILMDEIRDIQDATDLAERILKELEPLFSIDGQEIYVSASIGIVLSNPTYNSRRIICAIPTLRFTEPRPSGKRAIKFLIQRCIKMRSLLCRWKQSYAVLSRKVNSLFIISRSFL